MAKKKRADINADFLCREIAAEMHIPTATVKPIVQRIFLKILKHIMYGRTVLIHKFGCFASEFRKHKKIYSGISKTHFEIKPKFIPKFRFSKIAINYVESSQSEKAERISRETEK